MLLKKARARARNILYDVDGAKTLDVRVMKEGCGNILPLVHKWMLNCFWHFAFHDADAENILQWCLTTLPFFGRRNVTFWQPRSLAFAAKK